MYFPFCLQCLQQDGVPKETCNTTQVKNMHLTRWTLDFCCHSTEWARVILFTLISLNDTWIYCDSLVPLLLQTHPTWIKRYYLNGFKFLGNPLRSLYVIGKVLWYCSCYSYNQSVSLQCPNVNCMPVSSSSKCFMFFVFFFCFSPTRTTIRTPGQELDSPLPPIHERLAQLRPSRELLEFYRQKIAQFDSEHLELLQMLEKYKSLTEDQVRDGSQCERLWC